MALDNEKQFIDRWLDTAIKDYGSVEVDAELDQRVLRNLRAQSQERSAAWAKWWIWAVTAAVVLLVASVLLVRSRTEPATIAEIPTNPTTTKPPVISESTRAIVPSKILNGSHQRQVSRAKKHWPSQFPTPQPLSEQERMFVSYAERFPQQAMLTKQEHDDFEEEVRLAQLAAENNTSSSNKER